MEVKQKIICNTYGIKETWFLLTWEKVEILLENVFSTILGICKNTDFFDFRKSKKLDENFFQSLPFHRSRDHLQKDWRAQNISMVGGCLVKLSAESL